MTGVEYLYMLFNDQEEVKNTLDQLMHAVKRADNIVRGLLDFTRVSRLELTKEKLNSLVYNALLMLEKELSNQNIKVRAEYAADDPTVEVDIDKIDAVLVNIILNAIHAMPDGGTLSVKTYVTALNNIGSGVGRRSSDYFYVGERAAVVEIEDTGYGIPEENIDRLFEPFFTTRRDKGGTGLGLSIVKNMLELHKGMITIKNRADLKGAMVTMVLPVKD